MKRLTVNDIEAIELGAAILGTGGGGNPYYGKLQLLEQMKKGGVVEVISLDELDDDAWVVSLGGIGAPAVSVEKIYQGEELCRAVRALERETGRKVDALISTEIGGANSLKPMLTASQLGLPIVDGDGMGRAFPEMQMTTFSIYGHQSTPSAMSDSHGNTVVFTHLIGEVWLERLARACVVQMGGTAGIAEAPMAGSFVKQFSVPGTITQAMTLGYAVLDANRENRDPIAEICRRESGSVLFEGKIVDLERFMVAGFTRGKLQVEGVNGFSGDTASVDIQNENLIFRHNGEVRCCVPDLIVILDLETGHAITTEVLRYGQKISVLGLPCHPLLRTETALRVIGPEAFGYPDVRYQPLAEHPPLLKQNR